MAKRQAWHDARRSAQEAQRKVRATKKPLKPARLSMYVSNEVGAQLEALAAYRGRSKTESIEARLVVEGKIKQKKERQALQHRYNKNNKETKLTRNHIPSY